MALPGLLIEYLINGACAIVWLTVLAVRLGALTSMPEKEWAVYLLPVMYVIGMLVDFLALLLGRAIEYATKVIAGTRAARWLRSSSGAEQKQDAGADSAEESQYRRILNGLSGTAYVMLYSEKLGQEYVMRSSRDRIARGAVANCLITTIVVGTSVGSMAKPPASVAYLNSIPPEPVWLIGVCLYFLIAGMWLRFQSHTSRWKREAVMVIYAKHQGDLAARSTNA